MALTELGTCAMSPVRPATAAASASSVTTEASAVAVTSPSASSVTVEDPKRMVASYDLSWPAT